MHNPINKMNNLWFNYYQTLYYYRAKYWNPSELFERYLTVNEKGCSSQPLYYLRVS